MNFSFWSCHANKDFLVLKFLESNEGDPELLVFIPFTSDVKIKSISIVGGADGTSPAKMRAFINRDGIDFSDAQSMQAIQLGVLKKAGSPIQHVIQVVRKNDPLGRDVELFRRHYYAPGQVGPASKDILLLTDRK
ncbi:hypothetical protein AAHE18_01G111500 [Arachis hypogaea]|nr:uncharacterized protein LOC112802377 isoform X2 [Arachis hypogaea]